VTFRVFWDVSPLKLTDVSEMQNGSIIRAMLMEAVRTSETSVNFKVTTRSYIPEDSKLRTRRRENQKSHVDSCGSLYDPVAISWGTQQ
jgi:hypothetical protein